MVSKKRITEVYVSDDEAILLHEKMEQEVDRIKELIIELNMRKAAFEYQKFLFWKRIGEVYGLDTTNNVYDYDSKARTIKKVSGKNPDVSLFKELLESLDTLKRAGGAK